jgi:hypothetical protein
MTPAKKSNKRCSSFLLVFLALFFLANIAASSFAMNSVEVGKITTPSRKNSTQNQSSDNRCRYQNNENKSPNALEKTGSNGSSSARVPRANESIIFSESRTDQNDTTLLPRQNQEQAMQQNRLELLKRLSKQQTEFQQKLKTIEEAFLQEKSNMLQKSNAIRFSRSLPLSNDLPKEKTSELNKKYVHQILLAKLENQIACYDNGFEWLNSYLPKREAIFVGKHMDQSTAQRSIQQVTQALSDTQEVGRLLIESISTPHAKSIESVTESSLQYGNPTELFDLSNKKIEQASKLPVQDENLTTLSDEKIKWLSDALDLTRDIQLFILGCHASEYIETNKKIFTEVKESLKKGYQNLNNNKGYEYLPEKIKNSYLEAQELLEHYEAEFSLMEATSPEAMIDAAEKNVLNLQRVTQEMATKIEHDQQEIEEAELASSNTLRIKIDRLNNVYQNLLSTMLAYSQIQDEGWIEKKCIQLNQLQQWIEDKRTSLTCEASNIFQGDIICNQFAQLRLPQSEEIFQIQDSRLHPMNSSEFLDYLTSDLKENFEYDSERIIGTRGKIALDNSPYDLTKGPSTENRNAWTSGIDLIRLAICKNFGIQVMNEFDRRFETKRTEKNSLKVREIKKFLFNINGQLQYPRSFFIDPNMKHENFLKSLARGDDTTLDKVIKIDPDTLTFNPFGKKSALIPENQLNSILTTALKQGETGLHPTIAADTESRRKGFEYVREALKKAFPKEPLSTEQMNSILLRFDNEFEIADNKPLLTLKEARDFIQREKETLKSRGFWEKYVSRYFDQEGIRNMLNGIYYSIGSHLLPYFLLILSYLYYLYMNQTTF